MQIVDHEKLNLHKAVGHVLSELQEQNLEKCLIVGIYIECCDHFMPYLLGVFVHVDLIRQNAKQFSMNYSQNNL